MPGRLGLLLGRNFLTKKSDESPGNLKIECDLLNQGKDKKEKYSKIPGKPRMSSKVW